MPEINTSEGKLFFSDHRKAHSQHTPVIFVHGAGGSRLDWPQALRRLPEANAIVIDLPGHGKNLGKGRKTITDYAKAVIALMDALDLPQAIIAGHSMGGAIAQTIALDYANRVKGLILIGTGAKLSVHPNILEQVLQDQSAVSMLLKDWYWGPDATDAMRQDTYNALMQIAPEIIHDDYLACNQFDVRDRLNEIDVPVLVIAGTEDRMTFYKYGVYLHDHIPGAVLFTVQGGGHMMTLEQPQAVAEAIRDWLNRLN